MKFLVFALLFGLSSADLLKRAEPFLDQAVLSFYSGVNDGGSLSQSLGFYDPVVAEMADTLERELGKTIKETLREILENIKEKIDSGKAVGKELIEKLKELRQKFKELGKDTSDRSKELLKEIRDKAKETLKKIFEKLRRKNEDLDKEIKMKFQEIVDRIKKKILSNETIQKIREYIKNIYGESPTLQKIKAIFEKLEDSDIREIIKNLLEYPEEKHESQVLQGETWDKIKDFFKNLKIKISDHYKKFGQWVKDMWGKGLDKLKDKYGLIASIAMEFISNAKNLDGELIREALEFFRDHQDELGSLWKDIVEAAKKALGKS